MEAHKNKFILLLFGVVAICCITACSKQSFNIVDVDVNFITNIDNKPYFSWIIKAEKDNFTQKSYQAFIFDNKGDVIWDSGEIVSSGQQFKYPGKALRNGEKYSLKIKIRSGDNEGVWSKPYPFYTPIEYPEDWDAKWIGYDYEKGAALPIYKKVVNVDNAANIDYARLYIAAPGFYEAFIDGEKLGEAVLNPAQTNYEDYTYYSAYDLDVEKMNPSFALSVMLGNGWYNQNVVWGKGMIYGPPVFIAQIVIQYKNGQKKVVGSNESWQWKPGPIIFSNIYAGETYNANLLPDDWCTINTDTDWRNARFAKNHPKELFQQFIEPVKCTDSLSVKQIIDKGDGTYVFDFGQNIAGWTKIKIKGEKNQKITIRLVEEIDKKGNIDPRTTGVRATKVIQTQQYICSGDGVEVWQPKFTYFGFRYAEIEGLKSKPEKDLLKAIVLRSSLEETGSFISSEKNINKLHELAVWTLKSNIHGVPTDCPHREKCGWTGDAHALAHALIFNYDARLFFSKYMFDMRSSGRRTNKELYFGVNFHDRSIIDKPKGIPTMIVPGRRTSGIASPDWGTAMVQIPWYLYKYYAETNMLRNFYPDMKLWVDYIHEKNENGIIKHGLGDWCPPGGNKNIDCPVPVSSTAFHILDLKLMAKAAEIIGVKEDHEYYKKLHNKVVDSFNRCFFDSINYTYGGQTANLLALDIGIVPKACRRRVAASVVESLNSENNGFIKTGIFGLSRLFEVLCENGFEDEVHRLLTKTGKNSFAYMWDNFDATTLWEVLPIRDLETDDMYYRSHNHPMQAGYDAWFYSGIAGINPTFEEPGFQKIIFKPYLTSHLRHAEASYKSVFGVIGSKWERDGDTFTWELRIPENSKADIYLPNYGTKVQLTINGKQEKLSDYSSDFTWLGEYGPGLYHIKMVSL